MIAFNVKMAGVTKFGRTVRKSVKMMEMEQMDDSDDLQDTKKRRRPCNSKSRSKKKMTDCVHPEQRTTLHEDNDVPLDSISGSDSNIGAECYLDDTSSHQVFVDQLQATQKQSNSAVVRDLFSGNPLDIQDELQAKKTPKKKDKKYDVRKPSAAFMEWSFFQIKNMAKEHPDCDFDLLQVQLSGFWRCISAKEKMRWHRRAQRGDKAIDQEPEDDSHFHVGKAPLGPIDIASHFSLVGDSLINLGTRLQEHKGKVYLDGNLSILLNSLLSTLTLLMALTNNLSSLHESAQDVHLNTIDKLKGLFEVG